MKQVIRIIVTFLLGVVCFSQPVNAETVVPVPTDLRVTEASETLITLEWTINGSEYAGKEVEMSETGEEGTYKMVNVGSDGSNAGFYSRTNCESGRTYYFRIRTVDWDESTRSDIYSDWVYIKADTAPAHLEENAVKQVGATANGVKVKWSAVKGATGYYVLLRPSGGGSDGEYKTIAKTKATQYTLKNLSKKNTHYDVAIKPYRNVADSKNLVTSVAALSPISCVTTPAAPKAVRFSRYSSFDGNDDHTAAEISWTTVSSKENTDGYQIQIYQVNKNGKDKLIRNIHKKGHHNSEDRSNSPVVYGYHFQEYKAAYLTHIIKVRVRGYVNLNGKKQYGPWSAYDTLIPGAHVKRHNVEFHSKVKNGKLRLNWFKVTGAKYYNIYRKLTLDGKSTKWKKVASKVKGSSVMVPNKPGYYNVYYVQPCGMKMGKKKVNGPKPARAQDIIMIYPIS